MGVNDAFDGVNQTLPYMVNTIWPIKSKLVSLAEASWVEAEGEQQWREDICAQSAEGMPYTGELIRKYLTILC